MEKGKTSEKVTLLIAGMTCTSCSQRLEKALQAAPGVKNAQVNFPAEKAYVEFDPEENSVDGLIDVAAKTGYTATAEGHDSKSVVIKLYGMTCSACVARVEKSLRQLPGVSEANINFAAEKATIKYTPTKVKVAALLEAISAAGYKGVVEDTASSEDQRDAAEESMQKAFKKMVFAASFAGAIMILMIIHMLIGHIPGYFVITVVLAFPVIFIAGADTHRGTWNALMR